MTILKPISVNIVSTSSDFTFTPMCEKSKILADYLGKEHLFAKDLALLRALGFEINLKDFFELPF